MIFHFIFFGFDFPIEIICYYSIPHLVLGDLN